MDFKNDVITRSQEIPVVVDFWAPWCGPCKFLGPVIEELAKENADSWELVKVNTDENRELSMEYGIQGIPAVKMFDKGNVVAEFTGALSRPQIEEWLQKHLPDSRNKELNDILQAINQSDNGVINELESFVDRHPDYMDGRMALARHIAFDDNEKATELVLDVKPGSQYFDTAEDIRHLHRLLEGSCTDNDQFAEKIEDIRSAVKTGDLESAMDMLIEFVVADKSYCDELPRKVAIAIFNLSGLDHPITQKFRRRFDMALY